MKVITCAKSHEWENWQVVKWAKENLYYWYFSTFKTTNTFRCGNRIFMVKVNASEPIVIRMRMSSKTISIAFKLNNKLERIVLDNYIDHCRWNHCISS